MKLVLCDDHPIVIASMAAMFKAHGHEPVVLASKPSDLVALVREHRPHVCVTDLNFGAGVPFEEVLDVIRELSEIVDVVVLSGADPELGQQALAAGATAVGSKSMPASDILALIEGRSAAVDPDQGTKPTRAPYFLTDREMEVLQHLSDGDSTARMAAHLGVRHATARSHVQSVLLKLGVHNRVAAVSVAVSAGMVDTPL